MRTRLIALLPLVLAACRSTPLETPGIVTNSYSLARYNGQTLPTHKGCGGYTVESGTLELGSYHRAARTLKLRDEATGQVTTTSETGTYRVDGTQVAFTFNQPEGAWRVNGSTAGGSSLVLTYPSPCDGTEVETYHPILHVD